MLRVSAGSSPMGAQAADEVQSHFEVGNYGVSRKVLMPVLRAM